MLLFYPFSGFFTKFTPPLQRIAAASVHSAPPTHLQKNCKKVAKNQPYASARRLPESFWGTPGGAFGEPLRAPWGACSKPLLGTFWRAFGEPLRALFFGGGLLEASARHLLESFWGTSAGAFGEPCGHLCERNKKPVLKGRVPHTNINNTNNAMAEFSAFCFRYKGRTKRIMRQSPQLSIFVRVNSPDLGSKPPRYR